MSRLTLHVIPHGLPYSPSPCFPNPSGSSFSSIVTAVEGDKRMAANAARFGGVR